ncbi:hypothetical protein ACAW74_18235 [Fibrella sp. WM1]|uniref:hypothetical protein n=1 Tax=Fibrella musci TaxID=3242485 RepID=UPI0035201EE7
MENVALQPAVPAGNEPAALGEDFVTIKREQLDRLKAAYSQVVQEKQVMQKDIGTLLRICNRFMGLLNGKTTKLQVVKEIGKIFTDPTPFVADTNEMMALMAKYQGLMAPTNLLPANAAAADTH